MSELRPDHRLIRRLVAGVLLALLAAMMFASPAGAHSGNQSYLYLDVTPETLGGRVETPFVDLREVLDLELEGSREEVLAEILANETLITAYLNDHVALDPQGENWTIDFTRIELFDSDVFEVTLDYALFYFEVDLGATTAVPREFDVTFDPFLDEIAGRDGLLLIANDWDGGVFENGTEALLVFDENSRTRSVDLGNTSQWKNFRGSVELGIDHIKTGPDHLMFVLALTLPSVLIFTTLWRPTNSFGSALWRVLKIMTMFTIAHSITFSLAGLDILPLPSSRFVESVIALSIAAAALHNIRPIAANKEWLIAFVFGLFHGMGFASLVETLEISRSTQLISLLGRNVGIEIGQTVVIVLIFPMLFLLRRTRYFQSFFVVSSLVLAAFSLGWGWERILETDIGMNELIDPLIKPKRAVPVLLMATGVAALIQRFEARAGRLIDVGTSSSGGDIADEEPVMVDSA